MPDDKTAPCFIGLNDWIFLFEALYLLSAHYSGYGQLTMLKATEDTDKQDRVPAFQGKPAREVTALFPRPSLPGSPLSPSLHSPETHLT